VNPTPPSTWLFGWLVLAAFAAGVLAGAQTVQRALPLPWPEGDPGVDRDWLPWVVALLVLLLAAAFLALLLLPLGPA
jgi:hypothetical protein